MADTCIVCLGDLATSDARPDHASDSANLAADDAAFTASLATLDDHLGLKRRKSLDDSAIVAHLLPCGHNLHNECLKPWVERANSCPICRQNFNEVELKSYIDGPTQTSYAVQDKKQVAEIDATMIVDEGLYDEPNIEPCSVCAEYGDEENLLLCDGCSASCHTFCAGLDSVPAGPWFCQFCLEDRILEHSGIPNTRSGSRRGTSRRRNPRRTRRGQGSGQNGESSTSWARVWQSVWDNLNLDLDFPFDEEPDVHRHEWQRRFHVAERQGAAARFRDTAATLLDVRAVREKSVTPQPESQEELRAWNAFEKAKELSNDVSGPATRNKRKSVSASPAEAAPEPERRLKRPRTRRAQDLGDASSDTGADGPSMTRRMDTLQPAGPRQSITENNQIGPSFLSSLLKEVETTTASAEAAGRLRQPTTALSPGSTDYASPASPSSVSSPTPSNHPSPRMRPASPAPSHHSRPSSPPPLTSCIEPIFVQQRPQLSPISPGARQQSDSEDSHLSNGEQSDRPRRTRRRPPPPPPLRAVKARSYLPDQTSPTRVEMSFSEKAEIQNMVTAALKPVYKRGNIDTEQYTAINREISRKLYDQVGEAGGMGDGEEKDKWQSIAACEVDGALKKLLRTTELDVAA